MLYVRVLGSRWDRTRGAGKRRREERLEPVAKAVGALKYDNEAMEKMRCSIQPLEV